MVTGSVVTPRLSPSGVVANIDRSLAVHAHPLDALCSGELLFFIDVFEYGVGFWNSFLGPGFDHFSKTVPHTVQYQRHGARSGQLFLSKPLCSQLPKGFSRV